MSLGVRVAPIAPHATPPSVLHAAGGEIDRLARQRGRPADAGPNPGHTHNPTRRPRHGYRMRAPALASTIAPTRGLEASVARKKITLAISAGSIIRFIGDFADIR